MIIEKPAKIVLVSLLGFFTTIILILSTSFSSELQNAPTDVDAKLHRECLYPVIKLVEVGKKSGATGFVVRSEKIKDYQYYNVFLTCAHCVGGDQEVVVYFYEDWSYVRNTLHFPCIFYGVNHDLDLAIGYFISDQPIPCAKLHLENKLYIGSEIMKIGCGVGQEPRVEFGKVTNPVARRDVLNRSIRHTATTVPGDSGSPLYYQYKVVGMTTHIVTGRGFPIWNMAYCLPIDRFHDWSKEMGGFYDHLFEINVLMPKMPQYRLEFNNIYEITKNKE